MFILKTIPHETIWGGFKLRNKEYDSFGKIGHLYSLFDDPDWDNTILNGEYEGKGIHTFFEENKAMYGLEKYSRFPLVLALVEAADSLSIQVHPDDNIAFQLEGADWGKNESWYFIEAPSSGWIYGGCNCSNTDEVQELLRNGHGADIASHIPIKTRDYVYVPAGTLHAMTAGSFVYEIEENSEYTYRFYDYDRVDSLGHKRELHLDKAVKALHPANTVQLSRYNDEEITERLYSTKWLCATKGYINHSNTVECITVLNSDVDAVIDDIRIVRGTTIILLPNESLDIDLGESIMARPII